MWCQGGRSGHKGPASRTSMERRKSLLQWRCILRACTLSSHWCDCNWRILKPLQMRTGSGPGSNWTINCLAFTLARRCLTGGSTPSLSSGKRCLHLSYPIHGDIGLLPICLTCPPKRLTAYGLIPGRGDWGKEWEGSHAIQTLKRIGIYIARSHLLYSQYWLVLHFLDILYVVHPKSWTS